MDIRRAGRLAREASWLIIGQGLAVAGALIGVRVVTHLLEPTQYGELALGLTVAALVNQLLMGPVSNGVSRFYAPALEAADLHGYLAASYRIVLGATLTVGAIGLLAVLGVLFLISPQWVVLIVGALLLALADGYNGVLNGVQNAARQRRIVALHQGLSAWMRFLAAAALIIIFGSTSSAAILGYALGSAAVLVSQSWFFWRGIARSTARTSGAAPWGRQILKFATPFASWGIFTWAQIASDRWALQMFSTTGDVGLYAVLFQIGYYPVSLVTGIVMQFLAPILYRRAGDGTDPSRNADVHAYVRRLVVLALGMTALAFVAAALLHTLIFRILVSGAFRDVSYLLPWIVLSGGIYSAGQAFTLKFMSEVRSHMLTGIKIGTAIMAVGLNCLGAYYGGIQGIVLAGLVSSIIYFVWMLIMVTRSRQPAAA